MGVKAMAQARYNPSLTPNVVDRTQRPIDLVHLARQTMGSRELECEVLRMFERQITSYFERVRLTTDHDELVIGLHTLKGASMGVGAMPLAELARAAEHELGQSGRVDPETLDDLGMVVAETATYIMTLLRD
jgi:HPt (histidine-containing phosphotransfer) domain-containing protein